MARSILEEKILKFLIALNPLSSVIELRSPQSRRGTQSGYYSDRNALAQDAAALDGTVAGIYVTVNPCNPDLLARSKNHLTHYAKCTTADQDITSRVCLTLDFDPIRPAGISSTDAEHQAALDVAQITKHYLRELGWPDPIEADSGNGAYLIYRLKLPNDDVARDLIHNCLVVLALMFSDKQVVVDTTMYNAARIIRLIGTQNRKGDSTLERPHRRSKLLHVPNSLTPVSMNLLESLAAMKPSPPKRKRSRGAGVQVDVPKWCAQHAFHVSNTKEWNGATVYRLEECPFNPSHVQSSALLQYRDGGIMFKCFHTSCQNENWTSLKTLVGGIAGSDNDTDNSPYEMTDNGILWHKPTSGNERIEVPLTNFRAVITADILRDDGEEVQPSYEIEAAVQDRSVRFCIPAGQFSSLCWVPQHLGAQAIVSPGFAIREHARAAIQYLSGSIERRVVYTHTGWKWLASGEWVFLHAGGALGPNGPVSGIEVQLPRELCNFALPSLGENELPTCVEASLRLLEVGPDEIMLPIVAGIWRSVLGETPFSLFLEGRTGVMKSSLAALAQQHFGPRMDASHLPASWLSTPNALERLCYSAKDVMLTIDDFCPAGSQADVQRYHGMADRLLRGQGNHAGRQRLKRDGSMQSSKYPRGLILSSGEDVPYGASLRARLYIIELGPKEVRLNALTQCQHDADAGLYVGAMSGFISWMSSRYEDVRQNRSIRIGELRQLISDERMHRRMPDTVANLALGLEYFTQFAKDIGVFSMRQAEELQQRGWTALTAVAITQQSHQAANDHAERFLELLKSAVSAGDAHLASTEGEAPSQSHVYGLRHNDYGIYPQGERIGWVDASFVYLQSDSSYAVAQKKARTMGEGFPIAKQTLGRRLKEKGLLAATKERNDHLTVRRTFEGIRHSVWVIKTRVFLGMEADQPDHTGSNHTKSSQTNQRAQDCGKSTTTVGGSYTTKEDTKEWIR